MAAPGSYSFAQILNWRSQQSKSETPYLWSTGSTYTLYNPRTGAVMHTFTGATTGTVVSTPINPTEIGQTDGGPEGGGGVLVYMVGYISNQSAAPDAILYPVYSTTQKYPIDVTYRGIWVARWNSTKAIDELTPSLCRQHVKLNKPSAIPAGSSAWSLGLEWNKTFTDVPLGFGGYHGQITMTDQGPVQPYPGGGISDVDPTGIVLLSNGGNYTSEHNVVTWMGIDAETGDRLWMKNYTAVPGSYYSNCGNLGNGMFTMFFRENFTLMAYDDQQGTLDGRNLLNGNDFVQFGGGSGTYAYGNLYIASYDGYVTCIDVKHRSNRSGRYSLLQAG